MGKLFIKNVRIITTGGIVDGCGLWVADGKIGRITAALPDPGVCEVIDGQGLYLSPGFIDLHNHGNSGYWAIDGTEEALRTIAGFLIPRGVTGFLASTSTASTEDTIRAIRAAADFADKKPAGVSQLLGIHLEGPFFSQEKKGAQRSEHISPIRMDALKAFVGAGRGWVRLVALAPELLGAADAIVYLRENGITVSAGHTNATYAEAMGGILNGITEATHMFNGMRSFDHREPGVIGACLLDPRVCCEMICDGIHLSAPTMEILLRMKGRDKVALISDSISANGLPDGVYENEGRTITVKNNKVQLPDGTLAGSTLSLNQAVANLTRLCKVPLADAVCMASLTPARQIGLDARKGSIEPGKDADLVLFDEKLQVNKVWIGGEVCFGA